MGVIFSNFGLEIIKNHAQKKSEFLCLMCILGELAGVGSVAVAIGISGMLQMTCDTFNFIFIFILLYCCYHLHTSRDSVSPVCVIFSVDSEQHNVD